MKILLLYRDEMNKAKIDHIHHYLYIIYTKQ